VVSRELTTETKTHKQSKAEQKRDKKGKTEEKSPLVGKLVTSTGWKGQSSDQWRKEEEVEEKKNILWQVR